MIVDDHIVKDYINGESIESYKDLWIYHCFGDTAYESPDRGHVKWVEKLYDKLKGQLRDFTPRNGSLVRKLFPNFDRIAEDYTIMLVVGFQDPYEAMVLEHGGKEYMIFDLIRFGEDSLDAGYSCHRVLTHELIHMCLHERYPVPTDPTYAENLNYIAFDEGFAHALSYPDDISKFVFDDSLEARFTQAKATLRLAIDETDPIIQSAYSKSADTGDYWDKFASIAGKLYLLKNANIMEAIYRGGWSDFIGTILS